VEKTDITIIGAGAIGLAISYVLSKGPREITVIEKNTSFGGETSSRNSEVIHAGLYYPKDTLKAKTCVRGREILYDFCSRHRVAYKKAGKLIVASGKEKRAKLEAVRKNALDCGAGSLKFLSQKELGRLEPGVKADSALFSPETGIFDSHKFMQVLYARARERRVDFTFSVEAKAVEKEGPFYKITVEEPKGDSFSFRTKIVINSAGLGAEKIASSLGIDTDKYFYRIHYCKGQYFRIRNPEKFGVTHLIYPPPTETDLGIHVTPDLAGGLRLGPDARYVPDLDYIVREEDRGVFLSSVKDFLPALQREDLIPDTAGIRPKLQGEGEGFRDFVIRDEKEKGLPGFINLVGIESPGLTSSLAIAEIVRDLVLRLR
jgi:L-2-hydroxyglutarate oxidase LhgO